jgi:biotin carboxyl carrier protein
VGAKYRLRLDDREHELEVEEEDGGYRVRLDSVWHPVSLERIGEGAHYSLILDNHPYDLFAEENPHGYHIVIGSRTISVTSQAQQRGRRGAGGPVTLPATTEAGEWILTSPMSGVVQEILVSVDQEVEAGAVVMIIEAMKMQNELHAQRAGTVKAIYVSVGQRVEQGAPLLVLL